jgi:hypothetical protein
MSNNEVYARCLFQITAFPDELPESFAAAREPRPLPPLTAGPKVGLRSNTSSNA